MRPMSEEQLEREIRRFLEWHAQDVSGAPDEAGMTRRLAGLRSRATAGFARPVLALALLGLLMTMALGLVLTSVGSRRDDEGMGPNPLVSPVASVATEAPPSAASNAPSPGTAWAPIVIPDVRSIDTSARRSIPLLAGIEADEIELVDAGDGGVWLVPNGGSRVVHVEPDLRPFRVGLPSGRVITGRAVPAGDGLWLVTTDASGLGEPELHRVDRRTGVARTLPLRFSEASLVGLTDEGLWLARAGRTALLDEETGDELRSIAGVDWMHAFGSLWRYRWGDEGPVVDRHDGRTGDLVASIALEACDAGAPPSGHEATFHRGGLFPVPATSDTLDAMVAGCPFDSGHRQTGPDTIIDVIAGRTSGTIDLGVDHGPVVALDGRWWVVGGGGAEGLEQGVGSSRTLLVADPSAAQGQLLFRLGGHDIPHRNTMVASDDALWLLLSGCGDAGCTPADRAPFLLRLDRETLARAISGDGS